jgi:hypothetical protein|tara:strand:+ start:252 stop:635 length:384 start_codon:yes stop_codon:yes gene_type:complete
MSERDIVDKILYPESIQDLIDTVPNAKTILEKQPAVGNKPSSVVNKPRSTIYAQRNVDRGSRPMQNAKHVEARRQRLQETRTAKRAAAIKKYDEDMERINKLADPMRVKRKQRLDQLLAQIDRNTEK